MIFGVLVIAIHLYSEQRASRTLYARLSEAKHDEYNRNGSDTRSKISLYDNNPLITAFVLPRSRVILK